MHRAAECDPAHIAARDYFDIFSLDIPSFDILSLDIWSFDMLSFFMPLSFDMLSLLMSSANAAGTAKAKASAIATGNSKRERTIILVLRYVVMVSIPSLLIRTGGRNGYRRAKEFCEVRLPTSREAGKSYMIVSRSKSVSRGDE
jgi:hypothetical protein